MTGKTIRKTIGICIIFLLIGLMEWEQNDYAMPEFDVSDNINYSNIIGKKYSTLIPLKYYNYISDDNIKKFHYIDGLDMPTGSTNEMRNIMTGTIFYVERAISCLICWPLNIVTFVIKIDGIETNGYPLRLTDSFYLEHDILIEKDEAFYFNPNMFKEIVE